MVPARRERDGSLSFWERDDPWTRSWLVPAAAPGGTRAIAVLGDSEDRREVSPSELDDMRAATLRRLARKYGARGIAVPVMDGDGRVAVAGWTDAEGAVWRLALGVAGGREAALAAIGGMFSAGHSESGLGVDILAQRPNRDYGATEYRIRGGREVLDAVARLEGVVVTGRGEGNPATLDLIVGNDRVIEDFLVENGFAVR